MVNTWIPWWPNKQDECTYNSLFMYIYVMYVGAFWPITWEHKASSHWFVSVGWCVSGGGWMYWELYHIIIWRSWHFLKLNFGWYNSAFIIVDFCAFGYGLMLLATPSPTQQQGCCWLGVVTYSHIHFNACEPITWVKKNDFGTYCNVLFSRSMLLFKVTGLTVILWKFKRHHSLSFELLIWHLNCYCCPARSYCFNIIGWSNRPILQ